MPPALQTKVEFRNIFRSSILYLKSASYVQTWKQACPICLRQGLHRQRWTVAQGRGWGVTWANGWVTQVGEQKTRNPLTEVNDGCPAVNQRGEGVADQLGYFIILRRKKFNNFFLQIDSAQGGLSLSQIMSVGLQNWSAGWCKIV